MLRIHFADMTNKHTALFRNDNGGLELRRYATAADAAAVSQARVLAAEPVRMVARHPSGGWTHALRMRGEDTARVYVGWFPNQTTARRAL
jgi:hypothetical protein